MGLPGQDQCLTFNPSLKLVMLVTRVSHFGGVFATSAGSRSLICSGSRGQYSQKALWDRPGVFVDLRQTGGRCALSLGDQPFRRLPSQGAPRRHYRDPSMRRICRIRDLRSKASAPGNPRRMRGESSPKPRKSPQKSVEGYCAKSRCSIKWSPGSGT